MKGIWCEQEGPYTCGLAALRIAYRYFGFDIGERKLITYLESSGFHVGPNGIYVAELAFLASHFGSRVVMRVPLEPLGAFLWNQKRPKGYIQISLLVIDTKLKQLKPNSRYWYVLYGFRKFLASGGALIIHTTKNRPSFQDMNEITKRNSVAIMRVNSSDFYGSSDKWGHYLVAIPNSSFLILDCYANRIKSDYPKAWRKYLSRAEGYKWNRWSDALIEVNDPNPNLHKPL